MSEQYPLSGMEPQLGNEQSLFDRYEIMGKIVQIEKERDVSLITCVNANTVIIIPDDNPNLYSSPSSHEWQIQAAITALGENFTITSITPITDEGSSCSYITLLEPKPTTTREQVK